MASETELHLRGNLCSDIELTYTPKGVAVAHVTVASTPRFFDRNTGEWRDGDALFLRCNLWREVAENAAESLSRGSRVLVVGRLKQRSFHTRDGEKRTVFELEVDEIGPSLRYATAKLTRTTGNRANTGRGNGFATQTNTTGTETETPRTTVSTNDDAGDDPWTTNPGAAEPSDDDAWGAPAFAGVGAGGLGSEPPY